jgi:hypothetical protein
VIKAEDKDEEEINLDGNRAQRNNRKREEERKID